MWFGEEQEAAKGDCILLISARAMPIAALGNSGSGNRRHARGRWSLIGGLFCCAYKPIYRSNTITRMVTTSFLGRLWHNGHESIVIRPRSHIKGSSISTSIRQALIDQLKHRVEFGLTSQVQQISQRTALFDQIILRSIMLITRPLDVDHLGGYDGRRSTLRSDDPGHGHVPNMRVDDIVAVVQSHVRLVVAA